MEASVLAAFASAGFWRFLGVWGAALAGSAAAASAGVWVGVGSVRRKGGFSFTREVGSGNCPCSHGMVGLFSTAADEQHDFRVAQTWAKPKHQTKSMSGTVKRGIVLGHGHNARTGSQRV